MADEYEFYVQASVRGYHAYFVDATVYIGEVMDCEMEPENDHDRYAVAAVTVIKRKPKDVTVKSYLKELLKNLQFQDGNLNKKVAEWNKLFLQRQQDWMSVFFSKTDMDIDAAPSSLCSGNELSCSRIQTPERYMHLLKTVTLQCKSVENHVCLLKEESTLMRNTLIGAIEFLTMVTQHSKESLPVPKQMYLACFNKIQEIPFAMDDCSEVKPKMEQLVDCLIKCLLQWKCASLCVETRDILLSVGNSSLLRDVCLLRLTWHVRDFATSLQLVAKEELEFGSKVTAYQNIFHALLVLEDMLRENPRSETVSSISCQLNASLLHISQAFPVFSHFLWRLQVLLMQLPSFSKPQELNIL
ncbi:Meiosis-specific protein mei4 [Desmophyllum pertusum]|uniref:Meiosis-specific protein mei4 n=1 Tax=Desmophyllum pertusum TaxID=174260 RepID=A0A9X0CNL8_9CNID|nr:Meiosis-specific protein mei4 [Desmophyllum pertusum]